MCLVSIQMHKNNPMIHYMYPQQVYELLFQHVLFVITRVKIIILFLAGRGQNESSIFQCQQIDRAVTRYMWLNQ